MLSSFTNSVKKFVFGLSNTSTHYGSRKRTLDENCDLNGDDVDNTRAKKMKVDDSLGWHIQGMPSTLKNRMARLIDSQKQKPQPLPIQQPDFSDVSPRIPDVTGDFKVSARPPIHHAQDRPTNGFTDGIPKAEKSTTGHVTRPTLTNGCGQSRDSNGSRSLFTPIHEPTDHTARFGFLSNSRNQSSVFNNRGQFRPVYEKTFNNGRSSQMPGSRLTAFSVMQKKQLEERETYKQLLKQFSTSSLNGTFHRSNLVTSTPVMVGDRAVRRVPSPRDIPVITLDCSQQDNSILHKSKTWNTTRTPCQQPYTFQKFDLDESTQRLKKSDSESVSQTERSLKFPESPYLVNDWVKDLKDRFSQKARLRASSIAAEQRRIIDLEEKRLQNEKKRQEMIQQRLLEARREVAVIEEDEFQEETAEDTEFPELTDEMEEAISDALINRPQEEMLSEGFKLQIRRRDMNTLAGLNWLNDEIINFYMNLLMERGQTEGFDTVYAFTTFFYPKLLSSGYSSVRRWTKRVNVFEHDILLVPIHLGMHWCLATIDFQEKTIKYYDSMGGDNVQCVNTLRQYLCEESLDKRKTEFDLNGWSTEIVKGIPEQLNGSDCGMFACKYAEYISRRAPITFTQEHMPYFRRRMVYEILTKQLL